MFMKLIQKKNLSSIHIILYIVLFISFFATVYHLFTYGISNIHSDTAVELTALESIFNHKDIFPSTWIYANGDINLMRLQVFLLFPFLFVKKWAVAREVGALLTILGGSFGLAFLSKKVLKNDMWLIAVPLYIACYTGRCRDVILDSSTYSTIMLYGPLAISFAYIIYSKKNVGKTKKLIGALMLLLVNTGGVRWIAEITLPLVLTISLYYYRENRDEDKKDIKSFIQFLMVILYTIIPSFIGTAIFLYVKSHGHFGVNSVGGVGLVTSLKGLLNSLLIVLGNFFACYGYEGGCSLVSVYGLRDLISVGICITVCFVVPIVYFKRLEEEKGATKFVLLFAYIHNVIIFLAAVFTKKTQVYHVITIVFYCVIIFAIFSSKYLLCPECYDKYIWIIVFAFSMIIESFCIVKDSEGWSERYEAQNAIVQTITEKGLHKGYGSYWNAYTHEVYSDGKIKMGGVALDNTGLSEYNWLVDTDIYAASADKSFLILSQEEMDDYSDGLFAELGEPCEEFEIDNAPVYDSHDWDWYETRLYVFVWDYDIASRITNGIRDGKIEPRECQYNSLGEKTEDYILLNPGGIINTPYSCVAYKGNYDLLITGTNVNDLEYTINSNAPNNPINYKIISENNNCIHINLEVGFDIDDMNVNIQNNSNNQVVFKEIVINEKE